MKDDITIKTCVIISTYNNPRWLKLTLTGYEGQTVMPDEVIVADDGSGEETRLLVDSFSGRLPIKHVWHTDRGFQKSEILNKAISAAESDYLIFTDQDCIPRADFVETHKRMARKGAYLSGGYFKLTMPVSTMLTGQDVADGAPFSPMWLLRHGQPLTYKMLKLTHSRIISSAINALTPRPKTFNGCNSSCWREDAIKVNGFDEDMHYGGQDYEFGLRLKNSGVKPVQIAYSTVALHLDHARPYKNAEGVAANKKRIEITKKEGKTWTYNGIIKSDKEMREDILRGK